MATLEGDRSATGTILTPEMRAAHEALLAHIRAPGTWWTGAERVAIAAEGRQAEQCGLCRERKAALSPAAVSGAHDTLGALPAPVVDVVHRVRTDAARLSRAWFDGVVAAGLPETLYVELVGVTTFTAGIDFLARAAAMPPYPLPEPLPGTPSRRRPAGVKAGDAWVPMLAPEDASGPEADLYGPAAAVFVPNIMRALSLVPDEVRMLRRLNAAHYVREDLIGDPTARRTLERPQMELVAARVSALNECFY